MGRARLGRRGVSLRVSTAAGLCFHHANPYGETAKLMQQDDRDHLLLAILEPEDRASIEAVVDEIIASELPTEGPAPLRAAASAFDLRGETLPDDQKLVAWQIAAALRRRARGGADRVH